MFGLEDELQESIFAHRKHLRAIIEATTKAMPGGLLADPRYGELLDTVTKAAEFIDKTFNENPDYWYLK